MTKAEIQKHIERLVNGRAATSDAHQIELIDLGLSKYRAMLASFEKKSDQQPSEKSEQLPPNVTLPTVEEMQEWSSKAQKEAKWNEIREKLPTMAKVYDEVVGRVAEPQATTTPAVIIKIAGNDRHLTQSEILALLKTYFKRVAIGAKMEAGRYSEAYATEMGKTTYKLFQGWNMIYNETQEGAAWPPLEDVFPGLARASQQHKVNADVLWRWASNDK